MTLQLRFNVLLVLSIVLIGTALVAAHPSACKGPLCTTLTGKLKGQQFFQNVDQNCLSQKYSRPVSLVISPPDDKGMVAFKLTAPAYKVLECDVPELILPGYILTTGPKSWVTWYNNDKPCWTVNYIPGCRLEITLFDACTTRDCPGPMSFSHPAKCDGSSIRQSFWFNL